MAMEIVTDQAASSTYRQIYLGNDGPEGIYHLKLDVSTMTTDEVDANGVLKPGVPLMSSGSAPNVLGVPVTSTNAVFGVTFEPVKLRGRTSNSSPALSGDTNDLSVAVITSGSVSRRAMEQNLGRALTADEIAGFGLAGCKIKLLP